MSTRAFCSTTAVALVVALTACASVRGRTSGPTVPIPLIVNNNLPLPTDLTIYAVTRGGSRALLGSVPPARTDTLKFKPVSFAEPYRLMATRPLHRPIQSQVFTVGSDMTGLIIWTLVPNIIGFEDVETDSTSVSDSTTAP